MADTEQRPQKRRRFFVDDPSEDEKENKYGIPAKEKRIDEPTVAREVSKQNSLSNGARARDESLEQYKHQIEAFVGTAVDDITLIDLRQRFGTSLDNAVNAYFDESWKQGPTSPDRTADDTPAVLPPTLTNGPSIVEDQASSPPASSATRRFADLSITPVRRYIGALGVTAWATRSGSNLLRSGDKVKIERTRQQIPQKIGRGGKVKQQIRKTQDVIVRFTNSRGEEVGRLEKDVALWISALIDQKMCTFDGVCIYAPDGLRTNDTVYLQLRAYLLKAAFESKNFVKPLDNNRETGIFEAKETNEERDLRLRQIGLVKLFSEINMEPSKSNETTAKHKREGILHAAEMAEQMDQSNEAKKDKTPDGSSPPSGENEEGEELEQDQLDSLYKKAQSFDFNTPEAQPAETFTLDLRKYQKQALHWMLDKETSQKQDRQQQSMHPLWEEYRWPTKDVDEKELPVVQDQDCFYINPYSGEMSLDFPVQEQNCLGGILADEMGLGKTIEMLSLIHTQISPEQKAALNTAQIESVNSLPRLPASTTEIGSAPVTTLVIAPMSLLAQWESEALKASKPGSLRVQLYYGGERAVDLKALCSPQNAATAPNVIITSYGTVLSEYNAVVAAGGNRGATGGLFSVEYWRIILDEAHVIKNRQSKTAKACYELSATHRWTLTGTPIVNRLEDLFSLVRFLKVEPWSNFSFWKTFITTPFEKGDFVRALDVVQTVLEPLVMRRTKDMKTPDGEALVPLPPKRIHIEHVELSQPERDVYDHIFARAKRTFAANVEAGTLMKSYTTIFAQILRLRQSCCHPVLTRNKQILAEEEDAAAAADLADGLADDMDLDTLLERFSADEGEQDASKYGAHILKQIQDEAEMECPICCEEPMIEQSVTGCWHSACKKCLLDYIEAQVNKGELPRCFNCREPISQRDVFEVIRHDDEDEPKIVDVEEDDLYSSTQPEKRRPARVTLQRVNALSSAKIKTLLSHLKRLKREDPMMKSVIFSQFASYLDLLSPALTQAGIKWLRFDGKTSQKERSKILADFANRTGFTVLFLSLKAGGVGLNLTCAKQVFMMDPWWSFAVEAQAIDRVHRMGQTAEVNVTRFVVAQSIEEKMLRVQERKKFIASSLGMMSDEEKKLQRIEDIRELLS